jgi:hypothetical protein
MNEIPELYAVLPIDHEHLTKSLDTAFAMAEESIANTKEPYGIFMLTTVGSTQGVVWDGTLPSPKAIHTIDGVWKAWPNTQGTPWSEEQTKQLRDMHKARISISTIARTLGRRHAAIVQRMYKSIGKNAMEQYR